MKRFRGRSCDCAKSDACGTFEAIKRSPIFNAPSTRPPFVRNRSLTQSFSRLGIARTSSALHSAYRKCSCRGIWLTHVNFAVLRTAQFAAAPPRRTATRFSLVCVLRRRRTSGLRTLKSHKNPPKTRKIAKKARKLLYDSIIRTTFGTAIRQKT